MTAQVCNFDMNADDVFNPFYVVVQTGAAVSQNNTDVRSQAWASRTMPATTAWQSVDYGNGMLVAVSSTSGTIAATSIDGGTTWVQRVLPTSTTWYAVKYGSLAANDKWVAVSSGANAAATSPDGCTWTARTITGTTYAWKSLAYGNGVWVALANAADANTLRTAVSSDGITWSNNNTGTIINPGTWSSIFFGNGRFVAVCSGSTKAAWSTDGISWNEATLPASTAWIGVAYGNGVWIAVTATNSDKAAKSTDNGATWSEITLNVASTWRAVLYGKNAVGEGIWSCLGATTVGNYSMDNGVTWNAKTLITGTHTAACYAPVRWYSGDTLTIGNSATMTVNTEQKRFWLTISIANGLLDINSADTVNPITFAMGRTSGAAAGTVTPASGLGSINVAGDWIKVGTGDGVTPNKTFTAPYTDYIPGLMIGGEWWSNATGAYGDNNPVMHEGLEAVGSGNRGKFFKQGAAASPYGPVECSAITATFANQRATRYLVVDSTAGIIAGAQILGSALTAATVVNRVISGTELELSLPTAYTVRTDWTAAAYGYVGGTTHTYVAISKNYSDVAASSTDGGVTWTKRQLPFKADWSAVVYGSTSGRFVAVCKNSNRCATSTNGTTWVAQYLPSTQNWNDVATNGTSFVAVGATTGDAATTAGAYSADGLTWVANVMTSAIWKSVDYGNSRYLAVSSTTICNYDTDGAGTWTNGTAMTSAVYCSIRWNGTRFVAISGSSTTTRYTTDGVTWNNGGALPNSTFTSMCWTGTTYVATSTSGTLAQTAVTSTDGAVWANRSLGVNQWAGICYGNSVTVAVAGASGTTFVGSQAKTSDATGVTWTDRPGIVSDVSFAVFNPYKNQLTNQVTFGDGVNGSIVPNGVDIYCPNIMVTSLCPANLHTVDNHLGASFVLTSGGSCTIDTALFDEAYHNFQQAQHLSITDAAFSIPFLVQECYDLTIERVTFALQPVRRYFTLPYWYSRELRYGQTVAWNYINGASITDLSICVGSTHAQYGTTTAISPITFTYVDRATFRRVKFFSLNPIKANQTGFLSSGMMTNNVFDDCSFFGTNICTLTTCNNNEITDATVAPCMHSGKMGLATSATRIGIDPATGNGLIDGTRYYFKARSYRDWTDLTEYVTGPLVSATPYLGSRWFPDKFSAVNTASNTVVCNWIRRDPTATAVAAYEVFRGNAPGFARNLAARVYTSTTVATVTATDATVLDGNTYYYVLRKYDGQLAGITASSGSIGTFLLGTVQNFLTGLGTIANCAGTVGKRKVYLPSGSASNFYLGNAWVGMPISGGGLAANTKIASVENELELTVDKDIGSTFVGQTLSLGAMAGLYVSGTGVVAGTKVVSVDSSSQITVDTAFSGAVSGTITFLYGTEGPEVRVDVVGAKQTASNFLFQSYDFTNATWVKTNITATAAAFFPPEQVGFNAAAAPTALGVSLLSLAPGANMANTQAGLSNVTAYCFSMYVMTPPSLRFRNVVSVTVTIDTTIATTSTFNATGKWTRIEVPFTSTNTTHIFTVTINDNGGLIYVSNAQVNLGGAATTPVTTTTAAVTLNPIVQEITQAYAWGRAAGGATANQGVEIVLATAPTGTHYTEIFMSTDPLFTPSAANKVDSTIAATWGLYTLTTSSGNYITGLTQDSKGQTGSLVVLSGAGQNRFLNINYDFDWGVSTLFNVQNLSNDNLFHNFGISRYRNYIAAPALTTANNAGTNKYQNIYFDTFDLPVLVNNLNTEIKGMSGCNATPAAAATTWVLGGTLDGIGVAYTTLYDMMFHELYHSPTTGALNIAFNDSSQVVKPYTILSGTPTFNNGGKLYLQTAGDSIEITWPHAIKGVSAFRNITPKLDGVDLGTAVDTLYALDVQFQISNDGGATWTDYAAMTGPLLAAAAITDPNVGFYFRVKITVRAGMKYTALANPFVLNEQIRGSTSLATAYVRGINNLGTTGDIILDTFVGSFIAGEAIVRHSDAQARATNLATNTNFALFPSYTSLIDGLQVYTTANPAIHYQPYVDTMTITVVDSGLLPIQNARVRVTATETAGGYTIGDVLLSGLTNASGQVTGQIPSSADVDVSVRARKADTAPLYKPNDVPNTFVTGVGLFATVVLISDV